jgi:hypothetical protein
MSEEEQKRADEQAFVEYWAWRRPPERERAERLLKTYPTASLDQLNDVMTGWTDGWIPWSPWDPYPWERVSNFNLPASDPPPGYSTQYVLHYDFGGPQARG